MMFSLQSKLATVHALIVQSVRKEVILKCYYTEAEFEHERSALMILNKDKHMHDSIPCIWKEWREQKCLAIESFLDCGSFDLISFDTEKDVKLFMQQLLTVCLIFIQCQCSHACTDANRLSTLVTNMV